MEHEQGGRDVGGSEGRTKHILLLLGAVFVAVLAVVVGQQMSTEAMAVVLGVACGVAASIPASLLLFVVLTRRDREHTRRAERRAGQGNYPPVVVIQGGGSPTGVSAGTQAGYWPAPVPGPPAERKWHVVGGDDLLLDDSRY
jgi:hypothetical protein